jgi:CDP-2,3-bis-(O-geranylgeranyl)-sn-glycerol synthase
MVTGLLYTLLIYPIIFILPAWVANGAPVIFGGGAPLDLGAKLGGKPLFGKHKTVKGTVSGLSAGIIIALVESAFMPWLLLTGVALSVGAIVGDLLGSFIKRRMNRKEGTNIFILDQYLFFVMALLFALPFGNLPGYGGLAVLIILTGFLHRSLNMAAHRAKIKKVPW